VITTALVSFTLGLIIGILVVLSSNWLALKQERERVHERRRNRDLQPAPMTPELTRMLKGICDE